jgi:hypothetical protein
MTYSTPFEYFIKNMKENQGRKSRGKSKLGRFKFFSG